MPATEARVLVRRYFGQGHDINFVPVRQWLLDGLVTVGARHRPAFTAHFLDLLRDKDVPASMKLAWNDNVRSLLDV